MLARRQFITAALTLTGARSVLGASAFEPDYLVTRLELTIPGLDPAHEGLRVAQLSDVHVGFQTPEARVRAAVREVNAFDPDVVLLTGDYVTYCKGPVAHVPELLTGLTAPTFCVLGNHDHLVDGPRVTGGLQSLGYEVLANQHTVTRVRGAPLTILGIDDSASKHDDVHATFAGAPRFGTRLVMAHNPPTVDQLEANSGLTCFSGHTHGGQLVVGHATDVIFRALGEPYIRGLYPVNGNALYVNRGLGAGRTTKFLHHGSEPEVALFVLRVGR